ncbi:MAG TPA: hypothetical protein VGU25_17315 [Acidobacteriaceae bacterium]|nr:hypothetical protein [Acidobacteriaceae bacterium]
MTYRHWFYLTLFFTVTLILVVGASSFAIDIFGVFRNPQGRQLRVYNNERTAKYLLNERYVPENFNGLLIGSSMSANWDVSAIQNFRIYNESIAGGNATEEKLLIDQALPAGHFLIALCVFAPEMTIDHDIKEKGMGTPSKAEALGSVTILREEFRKEFDLLSREGPEYFPNGDRVIEAKKMLADWLPPVWPVDPEGIRDYDALLSELRSHEIKIVFVVPPVRANILEARRGFLQSYRLRVNPIRPGEALIDFNSNKYDEFRKNPDNYIDDAHLTPAGAQEISRALNEELQLILARQR